MPPWVSVPSISTLSPNTFSVLGEREAVKKSPDRGRERPPWRSQPVRSRDPSRLSPRRDEGRHGDRPLQSNLFTASGLG